MDKGKKEKGYWYYKKEIEEIKIRVLLELGLTPFSPEVTKFTDVHWFMYYHMIVRKDVERIKWFRDLLLNVLGLQLEDGKIVPLSWLVNPEAMKMLSEKEEVSFGDERLDISEEESLRRLEEFEKIRHGGEVWQR